MSVRGDDGTVIKAELTPKHGMESSLSHATDVWKDFSKTKHVEGKQLKRWSIKRHGQGKLNGLASDPGPELRDGDEVIFHVGDRAA